MKHAKDIVEPIFSAHCQAAIVLKPSQQAVGSPRLCLEADFRQRYNQTVPADRESADVPLGGEVTRQKALLNELFARVSEAIVLLDADDRILKVNPEFTRIFGYAQEEALGRPINELVAPDELRAEAEEYTRRVTRGEVLNVETVRQRKDGARVPVSIVAVPVSIAGSQLSEYVIYRDITERKRAEQRLRQSEAYLAEVQRLSQTGSWAHIPRTGEITYWSEQCYRVLGFDPAGPPPPFEAFFQRIHPDDQPVMRRRYEEAVLERADFELDYRLVHPSTGIRNIHVVGHAVLDRSGDLGEFVGTVIDVTERKSAEQELQQLVDFVPQLIVVFDSDGKVIHANRVAREYTGLTLEEFRSGDVIGRVIHPDDVERVRAARKHGFAGSEPFELDARLLGKDGIHRWFLGQYNPFAEEGRVRRWYVSATEIESRKQEEERVRKENVRLEERTRIAQELHDTLLQTFQSASLHLGAAVYRVAQDSPVKPQLDRILQIMRQGIAEGRSAIQGLRSSGSQTSDLVVALSRIQEELEVPPDIDFRVIVTGRQRQLPREIQDEIYRIGREALANAFCHSGAKRVELELEYSDSELRIRIRDNGCGIDPQVLEKGRDGHWGLAGMRERATRIGGLLKILSSATAGTEVELSIPSGISWELSFSHHSSE
jgi:PAS domain S-box-containing protein